MNQNKEITAEEFIREKGYHNGRPPRFSEAVELAQLYHTQRIEAAGEGLIESNSIDFSYLPHMTSEGLRLLRYGAESMRTKCLQLLAKKDDDRKKERAIEIRCIQTNNENIAKAKQIISDKDAEISKLKEENERLKNNLAQYKLNALCESCGDKISFENIDIFQCQKCLQSQFESKDKQIQELKEDIINFAKWVDYQVVYDDNGKMSPTWEQLYSKYEEEKQTK